MLNFFHAYAVRVSNPDRQFLAVGVMADEDGALMYLVPGSSGRILRGEVLGEGSDYLKVAAPNANTSDPEDPSLYEFELLTRERLAAMGDEVSGSASILEQCQDDQALQDWYQATFLDESWVERWRASQEGPAEGSGAQEPEIAGGETK